EKLVSAGCRILTLDLKRMLKSVSISRNKNIYDLSIAQYVMDPGRSSYDYDDLARSMLGINAESRAELIGKSSVYETFMNAETKDKAVKLAAYSALIPLLSESRVMQRLKKDGSLGLFENIEMPLVYTLNDMENAGIEVDRRALSDYAVVLKGEIDVLTKEIYGLAGEQFNINSPKQLGAILFEKLGIEGGKKTKTGYSTAADVLEKLAGDNEIIRKILRYRTLSKLHSTYAAGLAEYIGPDDRIHGTFNQTITATGRISSTDPNLQNIPVRTEEGKEIRKVFVPRKGYTFVDADYSQVELRILAALSGDSVLIDAYKNAVDVHTLTASQVFHTPIDEVTPEMRRNAKAVNFGIVYGISAFGLGADLSISRKEAAEYIEQYFKSYPKVKAYLDKQVSDAKAQGFVRTYFGRIRPIPELKSGNFMQRSFGERIAMNSPIQGTAADIMKIAMNNTAVALSEAGLKSRIVLQVHDELLIETLPEELERVREIVRVSMEEAADLPVRLSVEINDGDTWYDCH
ncbi:MAG: DNA polymerase I, partial [Eubacteriales bacterium]|nr:DNA polymerase I [Eubacteriales bacterium]